MVLARAGWARSVGGANPYQSLHARAGTSRAEADEAVAALNILELPTVRGCTYVLPAADFPLGLQLARGHAQADLNVMAKLGVPQEEIERLGHQVVAALANADGPLDPAGLKAALGDAVRNLGAEGKKRGASTTLPTALGQLQVYGRIRRMPVAGRLDQQRYAYMPWEPEPSGLTDDAARTEILRRYFEWTGGATVAQSRWFTAFTAAQTTTALAELAVTDVGDGLLVPDVYLDEFAEFTIPTEPHYRLLSEIDSLLLLRRNAPELLDPQDAALAVPGESKQLGLQPDLPDHPILDRGRIIGLWQYDPERAEVVTWVFDGRRDSALDEEIERTRSWIADELGDFRSFSLDSPAGRQPRLAALRAATGN